MSGVPMKTKVTGVVKSVMSGDTVILVKPGVPKSGPPPEVRMSLSSLKAPSLKPPSAGGPSADEPYAWAAREFLRKTLVGKTVMFVLEYNVPQLNRPMGTIFCNNEKGEVESVSKMILRQGLAKVRRPNNAKEDRSFEYEDLCAIEDEAQEQKIGVFAEGDFPQALSRNLMMTQDPVEFAKEVRGQTLNGIVDHVINGSATKILFAVAEKPGHYRHLTVCLSGVQSPGFRRAEGQTGEDGAPPPVVAMPFALNAKFYTESILLQRDVEVFVEGADKMGNLYGQINLPGSTVSLSDNLLRMGYAKTVGWSMELTKNAAILRAAEKGARDARIGVWHDYKPDPNAAIASSDVYMGRVVEIVSGDTIVVADDASGDFKRVCFSSLRAPRLGRGGEKDAPMSWEGREYLRQRLIGRRVKVSVDYFRKPTEESPFKDVMVYATILREKGGKENGEENIGLGLVSGGYVSLVRHRNDEERARDYELYVQLEKEASTKKRGIHSEKPPQIRRVNDLTGNENKKRSKEMLSSFQDSGPHRGVLEHASTGSRFRVYLPKESCMIAVALKGVRAPQPSRAIQGEAPQKGQPFGDEALHYVKLSFLQREVEVEIESVDKMGAYLGTIRLQGATPTAPKVDIGLSLLTNGYAMLNEFFDPSRDSGGEIYVNAQNDAKSGDKGLWKEQNPLEEAAAKEEAEKNDIGSAITGRVVDVGYAGKLVLHAGKGVDETVNRLESALESMSISDGGVPGSTVRTGEGYAVRFSHDGKWYRAKIQSVDVKGGHAKVRFIDYGMEEWVPFQDIQKLPPAAASIPKLAVEIRMLYVVVPGQDHECGVPAGEFLRDLVYGQEVSVNVSYRDSSDGAIVGVVTVGGKDVAEELLKVGLARILRQHTRASKEAFQKYAAAEDKGRNTRSYLWTYGDPYGSDEDDTAAEKEIRERRYGGVPKR